MDEIQKAKLLADMKKYPCHYSREDMYAYIDCGILTYEDLVLNSNILDEDGFHHIIKYPHIWKEMDQLPYYPLDVEMPISGNIDILPFGISGSGGKTSLLAAIMTLFDNKNFVLHESYGAGYARYLSDCMFRNALLPATDQSYIQVIPQIRNYAPNMIQKRKESASLVKGGTVHRMSP